jgi:transcriptional regulator of acetoin/glycerol metabolism
LLCQGPLIGPDDLPENVRHPSLAKEIAPGGDERQRIVEALDRCGGNQTRAAELLGISRRTLVTRLGQFGLRKKDERG